MHAAVCPHEDFFVPLLVCHASSNVSARSMHTARAAIRSMIPNTGMPLALVVISGANLPALELKAFVEAVDGLGYM